MAPLVEALSQSVEPHLERPFVFFGHSMGAVIAFELARSLRRGGRLLPLYLLVSGARAPQFRRGHVPPPPPSDTELLDQLRHLDGTPREVLGNDELMRMMLPAMRADTTLYRNYIYVEEPPLACPIRAYSGLDDPNIRRAQLEAWAAETTADFKLRMFPGGHFYLNSAQAEFLEALARDLLPLTVRG
jgi:medium-chain acyl-[acyl-carrier-protein] hydrolase